MGRTEAGAGLDGPDATVGQLGMQYVILSNKYDFTEEAFSDLFRFENVQFYRNTIISNSRLLQKAFHISTSHRASILFPFRDAWARWIVDMKQINPNRPVCFIYMNERLDRLRRIHFFDYIEEKCSETYHVVYCDDLIRDDDRSIEYAKARCNLVFSYDKRDADKHKIYYYPSFYSASCNSAARESKYDVVFIGRAKNRLAEIYRAYDELNDAGLTCKFVVNRIDNNSIRSDCSMIEYNRELSYKDVTKYVSQSNCILDINQKGATGQSYRVNEAIAYRKKLLTDNPYVRELPQFDSRYMHIISEHLTDADVELARNREPVRYDYPLERLSPIAFIEEIERLLSLEMRR